MYNGEIIDTHMHLWALENNYPWLSNSAPEFEQLIGNYDSLRRDFLVKNYIEMIKAHNVTKSVHLQAFGFPDNPVGETKWLQEQANQFGFPHAIVAFANLADPHVSDTLKKHMMFANVRGIRMPLNYHDKTYLRMTDRADYLTDLQWQEGFSLLSEYNLSFDVQIYDHQIDDVVTLAKKFPDIALIVEHFAWPTDLSDEGFWLWKQRLAKLTIFPNVYLKLSGIGCVFQKLALEKVNQYITTAVKLFGADKCLFGSNCPPDSLFYDFNTLIMIFKRALAILPEEDQHKIFYLNAKNVYRL